MADADLDVISPGEANLRQTSGGYLASGAPAPRAALVDTGPPAQSPVPVTTQANTRSAPQLPLLEAGEVSIKSKPERDTLMAHLKDGSLPSDIAVTVAQAIKNYDDNYVKTQAEYQKQQQNLGVLDRFGQAVGNDADANIEGSRQIGALGMESGIRMVENLGQLGLNTLNFISGGKTMRPALIAGFPGSTQDVKDFNADVVQRRQYWSDDMRQKHGDVPWSTAADVGAGILSMPVFMSRAGLVLKGAEETGLASTLGQESARMAGLTASDFDPKAISLLDKGGALTVGAAFPLVAAGAGAAWDVGKSLATLGSEPGSGMVSQGLKNNLVRTILRRQDPESTRGAAQATDFFNSVGVTPANDVPLSLGQSTGDPRIISYENRFTDVQTRDFSKTQSNDLLNAASALRDQLNSAAGGSGVAGVGAGTYNAINKVDGAIRLQRASDWENGTANVNNVAEAVRDAQGGTPVTFPITNTVKTVNDVVKDLNNPAAMADPTIKARLSSLSTLLNDAQSKGGKFTPQGLMGILQGLNAGKIYGGGAAGGAPGGADAALEAIRSKVMDAVYQDAAAAGQNAQPVATAIADMRARYAQQSEALRRLQNDTMTKLFGNADVMSDPASATDAFLKLDPSAQNYGVQILRERAPQVLYGMQSRLLENAINAATDPTKAAMAGQFDIKAFSDSLYGSGAVRSGIFTSDTLKQVEDAKGYVASILNNKNSIVRPGTQIWPEDIAINLISRSPEFLARAVTRVMTGLNAERLFVTPEGINALKTVANLRSAPKEAATATTLYLGSLMEDSNTRIKQATDAAATQQYNDQRRAIGK